MVAILFTFALLIALAVVIYTDSVIVKVMENYDEGGDIHQDLIDHIIDHMANND
ncbi:hypothetical protein LAh9_124 [Aeromonas phage LAh_9]|uniref:Uncharacterized protein n=4 Tax=Lahexavirus TaxID=2843411 RepID=A0A514A150_9CAUD|nr:hypothetical protein HWC29_gp135 [Aeromonas phage 4_4572]YP_009847212.1 hypothetical protein HWC30_gp038 [Aeromonas phage LAh_6]YP_009847435.1 hypothetical protein HWC31_gp097 [Aeromonas phage LAh_8]YP_009847606.1 hypothetical protein HWC32_gp125 [Aeromonas phage LAh_9]QDH46624.1 hypothetical protein LAh6_38 [Aeromonas phage LAh_6]QDH46854.1 hypothetical protein LAh8_96 [Aeromonas phage LAh_8]QDH46994.1 hypothetical protein LAh9_124 [Aeromonas phage LAh_9]QEG09051.1 hypothetical protein [